MADILIKLDENILPGVAKAIMDKTGKIEPLPLTQFASEIESISVGEDPVLQDKVFDKNGTFFPDEGYDGFNEVTISIPVEELPTAEGVEF